MSLTVPFRLLPAAPTRNAGPKTPDRRVRDKVASDAESGIKSRRKPGRSFFVTISLGEVYNTVREDFIQFFTNIVTFCVAVEISKVSSSVENHLHAFLEFDSPCFVDELADYIRVFAACNHVNVQPCRSRKSCLRYISKEDRDLYFNCRVTELNFNYRAYHWAKNAVRFSFIDPFVMEHRFCYRFLQQVFSDVKKESEVSFQGFKVHPLVYGLSWVDSVCTWWNSRVLTHGYKRKQLYLWGESNTGKSSFVERLVGKRNQSFIFNPDIGKFAYSDFDNSLHKIIIFEEFDLKYHVISFLKRLLEGRTFAAPVKCGPPKYIKFNGPVIFVSNENLPNDVDNALRNRLLVVEADSDFWPHYEANSALPAPKVESTSEDSVVSVSSSSGDSEEESDGHDTVD